MYVTIRWADQSQDKEEEFTVNNAVYVTQALRPTKVLLDNQADAEGTEKNQGKRCRRSQLIVD